MRRVFENVSGGLVLVPDLGFEFMPGACLDLMKHIDDTPLAKRETRIDKSENLRTAVKMGSVKRVYELESDPNWRESLGVDSVHVNRSAGLNLRVINKQLKEIAKTDIPDRYAPKLPEQRFLNVVTPSPVVATLFPSDRGANPGMAMKIESVVDVKKPVAKTEDPGPRVPLAPSELRKKLNALSKDEVASIAVSKKVDVADKSKAAIIKSLEGVGFYDDEFKQAKS